MAIKISLEPVANGLVQKDPRPARPEHDGHGPRRRVDGRELEPRLAHGLTREPAPAVLLEEEVERDAAATTVGADLALAVVLHDHRHVESRERAHIADRPAGSRGDV